MRFYVFLKTSYRDVDGVLQRANNTEYGLASGVFTRDINKAMYVSEKLDGVQSGADTGFEIIAGNDGFHASCLDEKALQSGDGALNGYGAGGYVYSVCQSGFFAGKFHIGSFLSFLRFSTSGRTNKRISATFAA